MNESVKSIYAKSLMSGILISIGCIVNLSVDNKYMGAFLFSLGLFTIIRFGFLLYTGKVGYIPENKPKYILYVIRILIGNACGTAFAAFAISFTRIWDGINSKADAIMGAKTGDNILSQLILGYFCGMLMYIAVDNAANCKKSGSDVSLVFGTVIPVMVFILCGFNHSIADCFYYFAAIPDLKGILYILIVALGNAVGGMTIPTLKKLF